MAKSSRQQPRTGCFFKLMDAFGPRSGELEQEEVQRRASPDGDPALETLIGLEEEVSGVHLRPPSTGGAPGTRDSGYSSLRRRMSVLDRLVQTHPIWLQLSMSDEDATRILTLQPPGTFLVRKSSSLQRKVISLRVDEFGPPVRDFTVRESQHTFSLEDSGISFADLFRMLAFYCVSRDVLPFPLRLPEAIVTARTHTELEKLSLLGAAFWDSAGSGRRDSDRPADLERERSWRATSLPALRTRSPSQLECSQSGRALCFINPLFLRVHLPKGPSSVPTCAPRPDRGRVAWINSEPCLIAPLAPESNAARDRTGMPETAMWDGPVGHASPSSPISVPCRVPALVDDPMDTASSPEGAHQGIPVGQRLSNISVSTDTSSDSMEFSPEIFLQATSSARSDGSQGESSGEEQEEAQSDPERSFTRVPLRQRLRKSSLVLPRTLKGKLHKMSGVFGSLMTPEKKMLRRILELSQDKDSYFGALVQDYVSFMQENWGNHSSAEDLLQTMRQFMTQMKAYLSQSSELEPTADLLIPTCHIDSVLEKAMHKCVLKPLRGVIDEALRHFQVRSGTWQLLRDNMALAKTKQPQELGVEGAVPPDPEAIERIRHKIQVMCKKYSPEKKVAVLLRICKLIYTVMEDSSERMYGADDFLPMLTYVLAQCDMPQLDAEVQYMMELLDPSLLQGEGGYYLTSAYGAMSLIKNFQEDQAVRALSAETRTTLHQWHRRRTTERIRPCVEDFQSYLRVAVQVSGSGCTAKTLLVPPLFTAREVCQLCARHFKVPDPQSHALFLVLGDSTQQLAEDTHPQRIKAELHSRPRPQRFHFLYRKLGDPLTPRHSLKGSPSVS
ncbi:hypothetical protein GJAV_G00237700 [Gymnothorax javanicus]|nr:hypothetical protein GJAV_G00237700 [Gymnothorax javanicus]